MKDDQVGLKESLSSKIKELKEQVKMKINLKPLFVDEQIRIINDKILIYEECQRKFKEAVKKVGLKRTLYPKYLMLTKEDIDSIFGDDLTMKGGKEDDGTLKRIS